MSVIMSHIIANIALPVALRYRPVWGVWEQIEDIEEIVAIGVAWECTYAQADEPKELDPWIVRAEFLELKHTDRNALEGFLKSTGVLCWINEMRPLTEDEIWTFQEILREELLAGRVVKRGRPDPRSFRYTIHRRIREYEFEVAVRFEEGRVIALRQEMTTFEAILCSIVIDRLRDRRFEVCQRPDCDRIYEVTSSHKRKFCSYDCAHLVAVRSARKRAKRRSLSKRN
jgi:hypothetical protein